MSTHLKEKLIEPIPGLTAHIKGREVLLAFEEDIGSLISDVLPEHTGNVVHKEMFIKSSSAIGSVTQS